ncbi:MAG: rhodanese-like domain-containing protein [Candidatus Azobacteroides sp.]|nr:rhodanese-like domain-containing protein [Candidatus Azobacteroides sp.]
MGFFNNLFNTSPKVDLKELLNNGAVLLDVRTRGEYAGGHAKNSKNIPLDELNAQLHKLNKEQNFVVVCASGMRSGNAVGMMKRNGFVNCYNGGSWINFRN